MVFPSSSSLNGHPGRPGKRAAGGRGRPGARGPGRGPTVVWAQPGCLGAFSCRAPPRSQLEIGWLLIIVVTTDHERVCYCAPPVRLLHRRPPPKGRASRAARAAERPAAPVRLGRGGEPPGLISPRCLPSSRVRQAPAPGSMYDPNDDTDVPSGTTNGAPMEMTPPPVRQHHESEAPGI